MAGVAPAAPVAQGHPPPEIIPLDGPAAVKAISSPANTASLTPSPATTPAHDAVPARPPPEPSAAEEARAEAAAPAPNASVPPHRGRFPWPVHGRVLASFGVAAGGGHNDGINIAAPRGAAITAVDGGIVAYAGNQLRGYGNLILVKHAKDRKSTRLNSSHIQKSRMPSSA